MAFRYYQYLLTQSHPLFPVRLNITGAASLTLLDRTSFLFLSSQSSLQREVLPSLSHHYSKIYTSYYPDFIF